MMMGPCGNTPPPTTSHSKLCNGVRYQNFSLCDGLKETRLEENFVQKKSWGKGQISFIGLPETDFILVILGNEPTPNSFS